MSLRTKCALLVLAFELTLAVTLVLTVRYIGTYFENAAAAFASSSGGLVHVNRLRTLVRNELTHLLQFVPHPGHVEECRLCASFSREIDAVGAEVLAEASSARIPGQPQTLEQCLALRRGAIAGYFSAIDASPGAALRFNPEAHLNLDGYLGRLEAQLFRDAQQAVENPYRVQQQAILILSANAVVGVILGVLGMVLIRRWVLKPVQELKSVADEIGKGNLDHRAPVTSGDELGQLSYAVNQMAADLGRIEKQMIQRERAAAVGDLMSYLAHNIRNPLAGIQASAEATRRQLSGDSPLRPHQDAIVAAIDKFQRWLRELEHTCRPLEVQAAPTELGKVVDDVLAVFRPMADRHLIAMEYRPDPSLNFVNIDARHFEQALAAVVGNALEVTAEHGKVVIGAKADGNEGVWSLYVADAGPGIPPDLRHRIFEPSFSTKRTGHGLGLALARKVVELHGGQISVDCPTSGGSVFTIAMPVQPAARPRHG